MSEWIITSSILILLIILLRRVLRGKLSLRLQYALWGIVLLRLLLPFSFFESGLSVMNLAENLQSVETAQTVEELGDIDDLEYFPNEALVPSTATDMIINNVPEGFGSIVGHQQDAIGNGYLSSIAANATQAEFQQLERAIKLRDILVPLWICGAAVMAVYFLIANLRFGSALRRSRREIDIPGSIVPVYISEMIPTPCLFGLFRPAVYITQKCENDLGTMRHVLAHEFTHYRHRDNIWAILRCIALAMHWYNPLVWWAAVLSKRDAELACDEGAIKRLGEAERAPYGRTLIGMTCQRRDITALAHTATTMTGSGKSIKERIALIAKKPKMAVYTLVAVIIIAAAAIGCTFSGAQSGFTDGKAKREARPLAEACAIENGLEIQGKAEILRYEGGIDNGEGKDTYIRVSFPLKNDERRVTVMFRMMDENGNNHAQPISAITTVCKTGLPLVTDIESVRTVVISKEGFENPKVPPERQDEFMAFLSQLEYGELWPAEIGKNMLAAEDTNLTVYYTDGSRFSFGLNMVNSDGTYYQVQRPGTDPWLDELFAGGEHVIKLAEGLIISEEGLLKQAREAVDADIDAILATLSEGAKVERATITHLERISTGTFSSEKNIRMHRLDYSLTVGFEDKSSKSTLSLPPLYLIDTVDTYGGEYVYTPLNAISEKELESYGTPEYIDKYGSKYAAACMEIYIAFGGDESDLESELPIAMVGSGGVSLGCYLHPKSSRTWTDDGWLHADGIPLSRELVESLGTKIHTEHYSPDLRYSYGYSQFESLRVYNENMEPVYPEAVATGHTALSALRWLSPGSYYCTFGVTGPLKYIEEAGDYETSSYYAIFRLNVGESIFNAGAFDPNSGHEYTEMYYFWGDGCQRHFTDAETVRTVAEILNRAGDMGYVGDCGFDDAIYLMGDGVTTALCLAGDSCSTIYSDGKCWWLSDEDMAALREILSGSKDYFYFTGDNESLVELYAREIYAKEMLSAQGEHSITDYRLIKSSLHAETADSMYVVGLMEYAFTPEQPELAHWWAGNTGEGEGEYEGMLTRTAMFTLRQSGNGYWECISIGTGGAAPEFTAHIEALDNTWTSKAEAVFDELKKSEAAAYTADVSLSRADGYKNQESHTHYYSEGEEPGNRGNSLHLIDGLPVYRRTDGVYQLMGYDGTWETTDSIYEWISFWQTLSLSGCDFYGLEFSDKGTVTVSYAVKNMPADEARYIDFTFDAEGSFISLTSRAYMWDHSDPFHSELKEESTATYSFFSFDKDEIEQTIQKYAMS